MTVTLTYNLLVWGLALAVDFEGKSLMVALGPFYAEVEL